jgi:hypothetical protein
MKKGQIKINLHDMFDMKSRMEGDQKMLDDYHRKSMEDHRKILALEDSLLKKEKEIENIKSDFKEVAANPFLFVDKYVLVNGDLDHISEHDFNTRFVDFLRTIRKKKK